MGKKIPSNQEETIPKDQITLSERTVNTENVSLSYLASKIYKLKSQRNATKLHKIVKI